MDNNNNVNLQKYFDMEKVKQFGHYVMTCNTPASIILQTDIFHDKTMLISVLQEELSNNAEILYFNARKYSQFNMQDNAPQFILQHMYHQFNDRKMFIVSTINTIISFFTNKVFAPKVENEYSTGKNGEKVIELSKITEKFEKDVKLYLKHCKKDRLVICIDEMDLLSKKVVVDIMELFEMYLCVPNVVYISAINRENIIFGFYEKYSSNNKTSSNDFFNKIISHRLFVSSLIDPSTNYFSSILKEHSVYKLFNFDDEFINECSEKFRDVIGNDPILLQGILNTIELHLYMMDEQTRTQLFNNKELILYCEELYIYLFCMDKYENELYEDLLNSLDSLKEYDQSAFSKILQDHAQKFVSETADEQDFISDMLNKKIYSRKKFAQHWSDLIDEMCQKEYYDITRNIIDVTKIYYEYDKNAYEKNVDDLKFKQQLKGPVAP